MESNGFKTCTKCGETKPLCDFGNDKRLKSGLRANCKQCDFIRHKNFVAQRPLYHRKRYYRKTGHAIQSWIVEKAHYEALFQEGKIVIRTDEKLCTTCWLILPRSAFFKHRRKKDGISNRCKKCTGKVNRACCKKYPEKTKVLSARWRTNNKEKYLESMRRSGKKYRSTPKGRLNNNLSSEICKSLRGKKCGRHWEELVGFTVDALKSHLEKKFEPWMSWDNYGKAWHIDHKIPIAAFNYETPEDIDFRRCWSLKNLRPLEKSKNQSKSAKVERPFQPSLSIAVKQQHIEIRKEYGE